MEVCKVESINKGQRSVNINSWKRGKVVSITEAEFNVCFLGEAPVEVSIEATSPYLAPLGFHTDAWQWRSQLKSGDLADLCDEYGIWYRGYIVERRATEGHDCEGTPIDEVKVAFRQLSSHFGVKKDENGDSYIGYGEKFDTWRNLYEGSIMPVGSMNTPFISTEAIASQRNLLDDSEDCLGLRSPGQFHEYASTRYAQASNWTTVELKKEKGWIEHTNELKQAAYRLESMVFLTGMLNQFGRNGGYNQIL